MDSITAMNIVKDELRDYLADPYELAGGRNRSGNWIFTDDPRADATFPRIQILKIDNPIANISIGSDYTQHERLFLNIGVFVKEGFKLTVNGTTYKDDELVEYILSDIKTTMKARFSSLADKGVGGFRLLNSSNIAYNEDTQLYRAYVAGRVWYFWK